MIPNINANIVSYTGRLRKSLDKRYMIENTIQILTFISLYQQKPGQDKQQEELTRIFHECEDTSTSIKFTFFLDFVRAREDIRDIPVTPAVRVVNHFEREKKY